MKRSHWILLALALCATPAVAITGRSCLDECGKVRDDNNREVCFNCCYAQIKEATRRCVAQRGCQGKYDKCVHDAHADCERHAGSRAACYEYWGRGCNKIQADCGAPCFARDTAPEIQGGCNALIPDDPIYESKPKKKKKKS